MNYANFAKSTLAAGIAAGDSSLAVASGDGSRFPVAPFVVTIWNASDYSDASDDPDREIILVTAKSGDTFTITRAQEGTSAANHNMSGNAYGIVATLTAGALSGIASDLAARPASVGAVTTAQFDKTSSTTLSDIPGLSVTLPVGTHRIRAELFVNCAGAGGFKLWVAGSATASMVRIAGVPIGMTSGQIAPFTGIINACTSMSGAVVFNESGSSENAFYVDVVGSLVVTGSGTFKLQFAQGSSNATASSVLVGATLTATQIA
jgi:hypothetical protein